MILNNKICYFLDNFEKFIPYHCDIYRFCSSFVFSGSYKYSKIFLIQVDACK